MMRRGRQRRVLFLCRGSTRDGLGHVMRCRSIALQMLETASVHILVIGDAYVETLLHGQGVEYVIVEHDEQALQRIGTIAPEIVVFDLERFDARACAELRQQAMTVSVCPTFEHIADVDLIFHRTRCCGPDWPLDRLRGQLRTGLEYAVVRRQCVRITTVQYAANLEMDPLAVAISMGGADAGNKTLQVLESLCAIERPLLLWVLLGEGYAHSYTALVDCVSRNGRHEIILAKTSDSMWRVMRTCALAVLAGGTVTYEAVFAGLPSINLFDNGRHTFLVEELVDRQVALSAGYPLVSASAAAQAYVAHLESHRAELLAMHRACAGLIDGAAAERIAHGILEHDRVRVTLQA